jgi:hypothetical protein
MKSTLTIFLLFSTLLGFGQGTLYFVPIGPESSQYNRDILESTNYSRKKVATTFSFAARAAGFQSSSHSVSRSAVDLKDELDRIKPTKNDVIVIYASMHGSQSADPSGAPKIMFDGIGGEELTPAKLFKYVCKPAGAVIIMLDACNAPSNKGANIPGSGPSLGRDVSNNSALRDLFLSKPRVLLYAAEAGTSSSRYLTSHLIEDSDYYKSFIDHIIEQSLQDFKNNHVK